MEESDFPKIDVSNGLLEILVLLLFSTVLSKQSFAVIVLLVDNIFSGHSSNYLSFKD